MATRSIVINLPDGQEDELILEFATIHGWTEESGVTAAAFAKAVIAEVIRESIKNSRVKNAASIATQEKSVEVDLLQIR